MSAKSFMLDTNVFNRVVENSIPLSKFAGLHFLVTRVQEEELKKTPCKVKRESLLLCFADVAPELVLAASFCFGVPGAGWNQAKWDDGTGRFNRMLDRLRVLDRRKKKHEVNQIIDIVIAETALLEGATLITDDNNLRTLMLEFGGSVTASNELWS